MEVDEEVATPPPLPPEGFSGVWPPSTNARPVSAPLRRPAGLVLGRVPSKITLSVWDTPVEMAGPPPGVPIKEMAVSAKETLVPAKVTPEPLIMSVRLPDQMVVGMLIQTEESTKEVDPAVYTQAQLLARQCGTEAREVATASAGQPSWVEPWLDANGDACGNNSGCTLESAAGSDSDSGSASRCCKPTGDRLVEGEARCVDESP